MGVPGESSESPLERVPRASMPAARARLDLDCVFDRGQLERIERGHTPAGAGEGRKWAIDCRGDRVFFYRVRTGHCIFEIELAPVTSADGGARIAAAWANRDPAQAGRMDDTSDARLLVFLVEHLLLGRARRYPTPKAAPGDRA